MKSAPKGNAEKGTRRPKTGTKPQKKGRPNGDARSSRGEPQHPGLVLAQILDDTPHAAAAKWFNMTPADFEEFLAGRRPMTPEMAAAAGTVFGTGAAPWLAMIEAAQESGDA